MQRFTPDKIIEAIILSWILDFVTKKFLDKIGTLYYGPILHFSR